MKLRTSSNGLEVAVIGMAGSLPGAADLDEFWRLLIDGHDAISVLSDEELRTAGVHPELMQLPSFVRAKGLFPDIEYFDAAFFDYTPRDAALMDPQVRALHQCVYHALEDAGQLGEGCTDNIGLFAGASGNFVWELSSLLQTRESAASQFATIQLNDKDFTATRIAYKLNLRGPCVTLHSACSTSLYAIDLAYRQLLTGACSVAVAAASGLSLPTRNGYVYEEGMILSPDGTCRAFSDDSNGTVEGNGMGAVVLKPLEDALHDRDRIYAVIRGSAANNDGSRKVGYTAPSVEGQAEVIRRAIHMADVEPDTITYVEAHGTGTALGDPVEIEGLKQAFRTEKRGYCAIGSLKSNIGHLDAAAGVSSFLKTVLALSHRTIPPSIHFRDHNPEIDFEASPFVVARELTPWTNPEVPGSDGECYPLRAGVSSFGIGGTNVHVVLEQAPARPPSAPSTRAWKVLCLSGADADARDRLEQALAEHVATREDVNLADLAYTLQTGRRSLDYRSAIVCRDPDELTAMLANGEHAIRRYHTPGGDRARVAFLFPGQGSQHPGMAAGLYAGERVFRETLERCLDVCAEHGLGDLRRLLLTTEPTAADREALAGTDLAQPALFAVEYATAALLIDWGVRPAALLGHSLGEYVAACLAEVMSLEQALALVIARGRLMHALPAGAMLAVAARPDDIVALLPEEVDVAAINAPAQCTVSGPKAAIAVLAERLSDQGIQARALHTSHAFHSAMLEPMLPAFRETVSALKLSAPQIPCVSNLTGNWLGADDACDPEYYVRHVREPVRFAAGAATLLAEPDTVFVDVGPGGTLGALLKANAAAGVTPKVVSALRHPRTGVEDECHLARALADLWGHGVAVDWHRHYGDEARAKVDAPRYPFARQAFPVGSGDIYRLLESVSAPSVPATTAAADGVMALDWQRALAPAPEDSTNVRPCLAVVENRKLAKALALVSGLRVDECRAGSRFAARGTGRFVADLERTADHRRLVEALREVDGMPALIVWLAERAQPAALDPLLERIERLALVLRAQCPDQQFRCLLALPGGTALEGPLVARLDATLRSLRATCPRFELRAVLLEPKLAPAAGAEVLEREIYDPDTSVVLAACAGARRSLYRPQTLPPRSPGSELAGRTIGVIAPDDYPGEALAARVREVSGAASVVPIRASRHLPGPARSALGVSADTLRAWLSEDQASDLTRYGLRDFGECHALLDEAATVLVARYVDACLGLTRGQRFTRAELAAAMRVTTRLERYVDYMLVMLVRAGVLAQDEAGYAVLREPGSLRDLDSIGAELRAASPLFAGNLAVLEHCVAAFPTALAEEVPPISVLYPDGTEKLLADAYDGSLQELEEKIIRMVFEKLFRKLIEQPRGQPLRILEAGGGFGLTMKRLAPLLRNVDVEYYFTDIGQTFLADARRFALEEGYDFLTFGSFDITQDPEAQGLEPHSFDLVLSFNVVHATRNLWVSVANLRRLLRDGGLICLLERTRVRSYIDLIWGLADGWWHFDEAERQLSPLASLEQWQSVAHEAGFAEVLCFPEQRAARNALDYGIVIAQTAPRASAAALGDAERWQVDAPTIPLDGVIVVDRPQDRPSAAFEPQGERLVAPAVDTRGLGLAALQALAGQRPGFISFWESGNALANAPDQLARVRDAALVDRLTRERFGDSACSRIQLPLDAASAPPPVPLVEHALGAVLGGLEHAVLAPEQQDLYALPRPGERPADSPLGDAALEASGERLAEGGTEEYEALLRKRWSELFGIEQIGLDEDFFAIGGDSLKVAQLTAELESHGIKLLPNEVFNHPTIRTLARYLHDNRGDEVGAIHTVEALLEHLQNDIGAAEFLDLEHDGRAVRVLFLDETRVGDPALERTLRELRLPRELQPNYLAPIGCLPGAAEGVHDVAQVWRALGLADSGAEERLAPLCESVSRGMVTLNTAITRGGVRRSYPLSPFQKMFLQEANRVAFYLIDFDEPLDRALLDRALSDVVELQGLLRSRLRRNRRRQLVWDEYEPPAGLSIPLVDLSGFTPALQAELLERLMASEHGTEFDGAGLMYRVMLVRFDRCRHTLMFNLDHSIFDNMSGQVLRRQLLTRYRQLLAGNTAPPEPVKSFPHYLEQLNRGPQGITKQKLIEIFDLERYQAAKNAVEARIVARRQPQIETLRFTLDLDRYELSDDEDATWEVSVVLLCSALARFLEQDDVPLKLVYQGRQYQDLSYFDTLGLFIDILPLLVPVDRDSPWSMLEGIRRKIRFVNRYNVNFMNMLMNLKMRFAWWDVLSPMNARRLPKRDPMILLNYVGKAEAEYQKIIDFSARQMAEAKGNLGYASLYVVVTEVGRSIQFDLFCSFEQDMDNLRRIFTEEAARLFQPLEPKLPQPQPQLQQPVAAEPLPRVSRDSEKLTEEVAL